MFESIVSLVLSDHMQGMTFDPPIGAPVFHRYASIRRPFRTTDGYLCMMVLTDRQWQKFFETAGRPEIMQDSRFSSLADRSIHIDALYTIVSNIFSTRPTAHWIELLESADIPVAKIETMESLLTHPHLIESGFFETMEHPSEGTIRSLGKSSKWSVTQPEPTRPTPRLGEHTHEVLSELGFSEEKIQAMFTNNAATGERK